MEKTDKKLKQQFKYNQMMHIPHKVSLDPQGHDSPSDLDRMQIFHQAREATFFNFKQSDIGQLFHQAVGGT